MKSTTTSISLFILAVSLSFSFKIEAQKTYTFAELTALALDKNFDIQIAKNKTASAENESTWGYNGLLPTIAASGGYTLGEDDTEAEFNGGIPNQKVDNAGSSNLNLNASANLMLFNGLANIRSYQRSQAVFRLTDLTQQATAESVILELANAYFGMLKAQTNLALAEKQFLNTKKQMSETESQQKYGQATESTRLNVLTNLYADSVAVKRALIVVNQNRRGLNTLLGTIVLEEKDILEQTIELNTDLELAELSQLAKQANKGIRQAQMNLNLSDIDLKLSRASLSPSLSLNFQYGYNESRNDAGILISNNSLGYDLTANLSVPIFNGWKRKTDIKNAKLQRMTRSFELEKQQFMVSQSLQNAFDNYQNNIELLGIELENVQISQQNFERIERAFALAQSSSYDLRAAQLSLLNAQKGLNDARTDAKLSELELLQLAGKLIE